MKTFPHTENLWRTIQKNNNGYKSIMAHFTSPVPRTGKLHLLVVDEDMSTRAACSEIALEMGFLPQQVSDAAEARRLLHGHAFDVILLELKVPGEGLLLLDEIKMLRPDTSVLIMHASSSVQSAVEAMRMGAADYLTKPFALEELAFVLERIAERLNASGVSRTLRERLRVQQGSGSIIGHSPEMEKLYRILAKVAQSSHPVLILGESGTGKELGRTLDPFEWSQWFEALHPGRLRLFSADPDRKRVVRLREGCIHRRQPLERRSAGNS